MRAIDLAKTPLYGPGPRKTFPDIVIYIDISCLDIYQECWHISCNFRPEIKKKKKTNIELVKIKLVQAKVEENYFLIFKQFDFTLLSSK